MTKKKIGIGLALLLLSSLVMLGFSHFNGEITVAKKIERTLVDVHKSAKDNGITVTINQVMKDGHEQIGIEFHIKSDKDIKFEPDNMGGDVIERPDISINGKKINAGSSHNFTKISNREYAGMIEIHPEYELPDKYNVKFNLDAVLNQPGQWTIDFSL